MVRNSKKRVAQPTNQRTPKVKNKAAGKLIKRGPVERNLYAASLLNPAGVKDARIPDDSTIPSITLQTSFKKSVTTDSAGNYYSCFKPTINWGGYNVRRDPAGAGELKMQGINDIIDPGWEAGANFHLLTETQRASIFTTCAAIRPVSMSIEYIPTEAAMTAQGVGGTGLYAGESLPATWDSPASTLVGLTNTSKNHWDGELAPSTMSDALTSMKTEVNAMTGFTTFWGPEDSSDFEYRALEFTTLGSGGNDVVQNAQANVSTLGWPIFTFLTDDGGGGVIPLTYVAPWNVQPNANNSVFEIGTPGFVDPTTGFTCGMPVVVDADMSYPWIAILFTGTNPGTLGELIITINWEAIPNQSIQSVISAGHSPYNPEELAQAANLIRNVPETITEKKNDPNTKIRMAAIKSTEDLYDPKVHKKHAVEGTSFFDRVRKFASKIDWSLVASAGKALLSIL